jgi:putative membrane protein
MNQTPFSQSDLDRIAEAVRAAESRTSGEIVPYFVEESDRYNVAHWRGGVMVAAIAVLAFVIAQTLSKTWLPYGTLETSGAIVAAYVLGSILAATVPPFRRLLLGHALMDLHVSRRASLAFLSEEVFKTRERTGILIFLSFFERRVIVLGDSGINAKVKQSDWDGVVQSIVKSIKEGRPTDGLVEAIGQCGELLEKHGVVRRRDDTDELSNSLRIG